MKKLLNRNQLKGKKNEITIEKKEYKMKRNGRLNSDKFFESEIFKNIKVRNQHIE
jgi:hypothetical protein